MAAPTSPFAPEGTKRLSLTERFDHGALSYIVREFDNFTFRPETDTSQTRQMISKYLTSSSADGKHAVSYTRSVHKGKPHGRMWAVRGLSLQAMAREIRNAISFNIYEDVDFHNCHPNLLLQYCEGAGIACPALRRYCSKRAAVLRELGKPDAKQGVLAVMNGGSAVRDSLRPTPWLADFEKEMRLIRDNVVALNKEYVAIARKSASAKSPNYNNLAGSTLNIMLCEMEHAALMALREFLEGQAGLNVGVLVFDGCMVEKKPGSQGPSVTRSLLREASDYVLQKTGFRLEITVKDMAADKLDVPPDAYSCNGAAGVGPSRPPRYALDDASAARMLIEDMRDDVRFCGGQLYMKVDNLWTCGDEAERHLVARCVDAGIKRIRDNGTTSTMSTEFHLAKRIAATIKVLLPNTPDFEERMWDSIIGSVCFRNGIYDFRQRRFFSYEERPDVMTPLRIERDFPVVHDASVRQQLYDRVLWATFGDAEVIDTYLRFVARATAGCYTDKTWAFFHGERNCGKGVLQALNQATWGPYVNTVSGNEFLLQQHTSGDAAKALKWAVDCKFTRQTYTNEIKSDPDHARTIKMDGNLIKGAMSGGDPIVARRL